MRRHDMEFDMILRGIIMTRGDSGATISEMRSDYFNIVCEPWPLNRLDTDRTIKYIMEIDGLLMERFDSGLCIFYIDDIGSHVSEHNLDSNNNVVVISETEDSSVVLVSDTGSTKEIEANNSYALSAPRAPRMVTSSFVNGHVAVATSSTDTLLIEPIENGQSRKRNLSPDSHPDENIDKRPKTFEQHRLPLIEQNLCIHNRNTGAPIAKATSTEIENSISIPNEPNGHVNGNDKENNNYERINKNQETDQLRRAFSKKCQIKERPNFDQTGSEDSLISIGSELFPPGVAIVGDDFMRSLLSYELYGSDFTHLNDSRFNYCISGQTVRDALHFVCDKAHMLRSKYRHIIVNVGAIDILLERNINDIEADYGRLLKAIQAIGLEPILTTIPNVCVSRSHRNFKTIYQTLLLFNRFLVETIGDSIPKIDLYASLSIGKGCNIDQTYLYYKEPKCIIKGNKKLEVWGWTEISRKKILGRINASILSLNEVHFLVLELLECINTHL